MKLQLRRILVIDDDAQFGRALQRMVAELGYDATLAATAKEGVAALGAGGFSAILLDLGLPDVHGHAVLRFLNRAGAKVPVIVVSGGAGVSDVVRVWRERAVDFLAKPFSTEALAAALDRALVDGHVESPPVEAAEPRPDVREAAGELRRQLAEGNATLPILDPAVAELQSYLGREAYDIKEVADKVGRDPALAAAVLRMANTAFYSRGRSIASLREACVLVAPKRVIGLALEVAMKAQFGAAHEPFRSVLHRLWCNSVVTSRITGMLAGGFGRPDAEELQVAALLHNIGELACLRQFSEVFPDADDSLLEHLAPEIAHLHEAFGRVLARSWKLPDTVVRLAGHHHRPPRGAERPDDATARRILLAAWTLALEAGFTYLPGQDDPTARPLLEELGVPDESIAALRAAIATWELPQGE